MNLRNSLMGSTALRAPDGGGGGGGSDDGALSGEALKGTPFEGVEGVSIPAAFVKEGKIDYAGMLGAAARPDPFDGIEVPDKFKKDGKVQVGDLVKGYREVEQSQFRRREEITTEVRTALEEERNKAAPAAPADYKAPADWKDANGRDFRIKADDPMFSYFAGVAHELRMPQDKFEAAVKGYVQAAAASLPDWNTEAKALGARGEERLARVDGFLKGNLSKENYDYFASMPASARLVQAIEEVMTLSGHPPIVGDSDEVPGETLTVEELRKMQSDPRYTGEKGKIDQAFVNKVRAGWQRLSKNKAA